MEALPDDGPASTSVLLAEDRMMRYLLDVEVPFEQLQEHLQLPERHVEQLAHQERYHKVAFRHRRTAGALVVLPEREMVGQVLYALHREMQVGYQPLAVAGHAATSLSGGTRCPSAFDRRI